MDNEKIGKIVSYIIDKVFALDFIVEDDSKIYFAIEQCLCCEDGQEYKSGEIYFSVETSKENKFNRDGRLYINCSKNGSIYCSAMSFSASWVARFADQLKENENGHHVFSFNVDKSLLEGGGYVKKTRPSIPKKATEKEDPIQKAATLWGMGRRSLGFHEYLKEKEIGSPWIDSIKQLKDKEHGEVVLIPRTNSNLEVVCLEKIRWNGDKRLLGSPKEAFFLVSLESYSMERVYFCEGWATAVYISKASGRPCVSVSSCANAVSSLTAFLSSPHASKVKEIVFFMDDDVGGKNASKNCIKALGELNKQLKVGEVIYSRSDIEKEINGLDAFDIYKAHGIEVLSRACEHIHWVPQKPLEEVQALKVDAHLIQSGIPIHWESFTSNTPICEDFFHKNLSDYINLCCSKEGGDIYQSNRNALIMAVISCTSTIVGKHYSFDRGQKYANTLTLFCANSGSGKGRTTKTAKDLEKKAKRLEKSFFVIAKRSFEAKKQKYEELCSIPIQNGHKDSRGLTDEENLIISKIHLCDAESLVDMHSVTGLSLSRATEAGIMKSNQKKRGCTLFGDEYSNLEPQIVRATGQKDPKGFIIQYYDSDNDHTSTTVLGGNIDMQAPCLSLFSHSTLEGICNMLSVDDITSGYLTRFLIHFDDRPSDISFKVECSGVPRGDGNDNDLLPSSPYSDKVTEILEHALKNSFNHIKSLSEEEQELQRKLKITHLNGEHRVKLGSSCCISDECSDIINDFMLNFVKPFLEKNCPKYIEIIIRRSGEIIKKLITLISCTSEHSPPPELNVYCSAEDCKAALCIYAHSLAGQCDLFKLLSEKGNQRIKKRTVLDDEERVLRLFSNGVRKLSRSIVNQRSGISSGAKGTATAIDSLVAKKKLTVAGKVIKLYDESEDQDKEE